MLSFYRSWLGKAGSPLPEKPEDLLPTHGEFCQLFGLVWFVWKFNFDMEISSSILHQFHDGHDHGYDYHKTRCETL